MIRWLIIALFIWLIYKLISGPRPGHRRRNPFFTFHAGRFPGGSDIRTGSSREKEKAKRDQNLDNIEEADYEDITEDKEPK